MRNDGFAPGYVPPVAGIKLRYESATFRITEKGGDRSPAVHLTESEITVGCTSATREAVEALYELFQKYYPKGSGGVKIQ